MIDPNLKFLYQAFNLIIPKEIITHILEYVGDGLIIFSKKYSKFDWVCLFKNPKLVRDPLLNKKYLGTYRFKTTTNGNYMESPSNGYGVAYKNFATNVPIDLIESVYLLSNQGTMLYDTIYSNMFEALYNIYELPRTNKNGKTILPFYVSKIGIPHVKYGQIDLKINFKDDVDVYPNACIEADVHSYVITERHPYQILTFRCIPSWNSSYLSYMYMQMYILVGDPEHKLDTFVIQLVGKDDTKEDRLVLYRSGIYGDQSVFKLCDLNITPNSNLINFCEIRKRNMKIISKTHPTSLVTIIEAQLFSFCGPTMMSYGLNN
jgi:hypothetical protein